MVRSERRQQRATSMPNWCENDLTLWGDEEEVNSVLDFIGATGDKPVFDFNRIIPYPPEWAERDNEMAALFPLSESFVKDDADRSELKDHLMAKYGSLTDAYNLGGHDWCVEHWGTKWNAFSVKVAGPKVSFMTAWSPPSQELISALAKKFPKVTFCLEYFERGAAYCGGFTCYGEEDWPYEEMAFAPGEVMGEWSGDYRGVRGG